MKRRQFLRAALTAAGVSTVNDWDRLAHALEYPNRIDDHAADDLERMTLALSRCVSQATAPTLHHRAVAGHLDTLTTFLNSTLPPALRTRIVDLAAETACLVGILRWNQGEFDQAAGSYRTALAAAREAGDKALAAHCVGLLAERPMRLDNPNARLRMLENSWALNDATPHSRAWLLALEANGWAMLGHQRHFEALMDQSQHLLAGPDADDPRPRATSVDAVYLAEERAAGYLRLNLAAQAEEILASVVEQATGRTRLWLTLDLALAALDRNEPERACAHASVVLDEAVPARIEPILASLRELPEKMAPYAGVPEVEEFTDRVRVA